MQTKLNQPTIRAQRPLIHRLFAAPIDGSDIEERSLSIIDQEAPPHHFSIDEWAVVRRMIHTTADFSMIDLVRFSPDATNAGQCALKFGAPVFTDSNMIRAGISLARMQRNNPRYDASSLHCHVADSDVAELAKEHHLPRSIFAVRKALPSLHGGIALFGNAPVALMELNRMIMEDGIRPALVIAMPVGFVHVIESKEELMSLGIPWIAIPGRRGGSTLAVAALHALCMLPEAR
jgi:precorrin isomerase